MKKRFRCLPAGLPPDEATTMSDKLETEIHALADNAQVQKMNNTNN